MAAQSSTSPCAACKFLRRKCQAECVFAPYFPPDQPEKFANVHRVFGASNVTKLLNELHPNQREDAVNSLAFEADMRLRDPVYGCVGVISLLQHQLRQLQFDLSYARSQLSKYHRRGSLSFASPSAAASGGAGAAGGGREHHQYNYLYSPYQFFPTNHQHQGGGINLSGFNSAVDDGESSGGDPSHGGAWAAGGDDCRRSID